MLKLNLGCATNKLEGYVNIDVEVACKPDLLLNFVAENLPYKTRSVDEILLFHTIEHISKRNHIKLLMECQRVLKVGSQLLVSYPEFLKCVENWKVNKYGIKDKWEQTLYGRQLYPSDYHVCIIHSPDFKLLLHSCGFVDVTYKSEPKEPHNTIMYAARGPETPPSYEHLVKQDMERFIIK